MSGVGKPRHVLIEVEARDLRDRAGDVDTASQIDVSVVEPAIEDRHANAGPPRSRVPRLGGMDRLGGPLQAEEGLVVADTGATNSGAGRFTSLPDAEVWIYPLKDSVLAYAFDTRNGLHLLSEIGSTGGYARYPASLWIFFTLPPARSIRAAMSLGALAPNEIR
jgi:hypothetical protein